MSVDSNALKEIRKASATLASALADYDRYLTVERRMSPRTIQTYLEVAQRFADLHDAARSTLAHSIRDFLSETGRTLAPASQSLFASSLKAFLSFLKAENFGVTIQDLNSIRYPKIPKTLTKTWSEDDLRHLRREVAKRSPHEILLFELLYGSGLRISEAAGLSPRDFSGGYVHVSGKGSKQRKVPTTPRAQQILARITPEDPPKIFQGGAARLRRWVSAWDKLAGGADAPTLHPHMLRHSIASHLLKRGVALPKISRLLGHASLSSTERYTHLEFEDLLKVYDQSFPLNRSANRRTKSGS